MDQWSGLARRAQRLVTGGSWGDRRGQALRADGRRVPLEAGGPLRLASAAGGWRAACREVGDERGSPSPPGRAVMWMRVRQTTPETNWIRKNP